MSLYLSSTDAIEQLQQYSKDIFHFFYDEHQMAWFLSFGQEKRYQFGGLLLQTEGMQMLLQYFLWKHSLQLESNIDTISIKERDHVLGYIRYIYQEHVVCEKDKLVEKLLYELLLEWKKSAEELVVSTDCQYFGDILKIQNLHEKDQYFQIESLENEMAVLRYLMDQYLNIYPGIKEYTDYYEIHGIQFRKNGFSPNEREIYERYIHSQSSSLMYEIYKSFYHQKEMSRILKERLK